MSASHNSPPHALDRPLEVGPEDWTTSDFYFLTTSLVIPRPIGWISTQSSAGVRNLAPYSFFNLVGSDPPYVVFGSMGVKDTLANLREVPEFVVNIATMHLMEQMDFTGTSFPPDQDEYEWAGLTPAPAMKVRPPRVAEARGHLECELVQVVTDRNTNIVLGRVVHAHVDPSVWKDGRVDPRLLDPVGRLAGSGYASLGDLFTIKRTPWKDVAGTRGREAMARATKMESDE